MLQKINIRCKALRGLWIGSLFGIFLLGIFGGCGREPEKQPDNERQTDYVWVPEYVSLDPDRNYSMPKVYDDYLWFVDYYRDVEAGISTQQLISFSVKDGSPGETIVLSNINMEETASDRYVNFFYKNKGQKFCTLETVSRPDAESGDSSRERYLCQYSDKGERLSEVKLEGKLSAEECSLQGVAADGEDRFYLLTNEGQIHLSDDKGNYRGTITAEGADAGIRGIGTGKDGKVYLVQYASSVNGGGMILKELDFQKKAEGASYGGYPGYGSEGLSPGREYDFWVNDGKALFGYDLETQSAEKLFDWMDCGLNGENISYLYEPEDGGFVVFVQDWGMGTRDLVFLCQKNASEVTAKTTLTLGALQMSQEIREAVVNFNRFNDSWNIQVKTYLDESNLNGNIDPLLQDAVVRMNADLISDNCPDLMVLNGIDVKNYAQKGLFEDLKGYLDKSGKLNREDYFENILQAYTYNDVLVAVPKNFFLYTVVGKAADLGTESGWTTRELISYAQAHPKAEIFDHANRAYILETMLRYNQSSYIDWTTGKCSFNSDSFVELLEFAERFPKETNWSADEAAAPFRIQAGELLLLEHSISDFDSVQLPTAMFGEDVCYIGYPNDRGESGVYFNADYNCIAITTKSSHKDGAWAFLEEYLCTESWGFPSNRKLFEAAKNEALRASESGKGFDWGGWDYQFHRPTKEEEDVLMKLIESAEPAHSCDPAVMEIVREEADAYFEGQKSVKEVADIIQSRVKLYVDENR